MCNINQLKCKGKKIMDELTKAIFRVEKDIAEIKVDLRHHIKRSDKHEGYIMKIVLILSVSAGAGILKLLPFISKLI